MTDKTIRPGDLVISVRPQPCCGSLKGCGIPFIVRRIRHKAHVICNCCDRHALSVDDAYADDGSACRIHRLIKIPPLADDTTTAEPIKETA